MSKNYPNSKTTFPDFPTGVNRFGSHEYEIPTQKEYLDKIIDLQVQIFISGCQAIDPYNSDWYCVHGDILSIGHIHKYRLSWIVGLVIEFERIKEDKYKCEICDKYISKSGLCKECIINEYGDESEQARRMRA